VRADVWSGPPRRLTGNDQADLTKRDAREQVLEALTVRRRRAAQAEVGIDHFNVRLTPAQVAGALTQGVLQPRAFLVSTWCGVDWRT
jgi:hypothetical protein